jgi:hypothetical protein
MPKKRAVNAKLLQVFVAVAAVIIILMISIESHDNTNHMALASSTPLIPDKERGVEEQKANSVATQARNPCPMIKITDPSPQSTILSSEITVNGVAFGCGSQIQIVEVLVHKYPFSNVFKFKPANLMAEQQQQQQQQEEGEGWSKWSFPLRFNSTGIYRILVHVKDVAGNEKWNETRINIPFFANLVGIESEQEGQGEGEGEEPSQAAGITGIPFFTTSANNESEREEKTPAIDTASNNATTTPLKKIAIVTPSFTETAYGPNGFYTFYYKYKSIIQGQAVTADLDMLSPPIGYSYTNPNTAIDIKNLTAFTPDDPGDGFIIPLAAHLQRAIPHSLVNIIRDEDVHNGYIFTPGNSASDNKNTNAYDMLIVTHDEYATQDMYDNYKRFVSNGGTLLALDGNIFYAQIKYNKDSNTITLVKGHSWEFDGNFAKRSIRERWFNENSQWLGSNFFESELTDNITFSNNPFNYTHFEENFVNNPKDKILIDYDAVAPRNNPFFGSTVATYELDFGKGKVVMMGLYGQNLIRNEAFLKFLDSLVLKYL